MGYLRALEFASEEYVPKALGIELHLRTNLYPPVPASMVQACLDAIDAVVEDDIERLIELPKPVTWRGQEVAPAFAIVDAHRLDAFVDAAYEAYVGDVE
jgi:hypothetical protein